MYFGSVKVAETVKSPVPLFAGFQNSIAGPVWISMSEPFTSRLESLTVPVPGSGRPCQPAPRMPPFGTLCAVSCIFMPCA